MSAHDEWCGHLDSQANVLIKIWYEEAYRIGGDNPDYYSTPMHVQQIFDAFKVGDVDAVERMRGRLAAARTELTQNVREHLGRASEDMIGWEGTAADGFKDYLAQFEDAIKQNEICIETMRGLLEAYKTMLIKSREDLQDLVVRTMDKIKDAEMNTGQLILAVVGAVLGVAGTIATLGTGLAVAGAVAGVASAVGSGLAGIGSELIVDGDDEETVIRSFVKAGFELLQKVEHIKLNIENGFNELDHAVSGQGLPEVRPDRPEIITAPRFDPAAFGMTDEARGDHERPEKSGRLVEEPPAREDEEGDHRGHHGEDVYPEQGPK